MTVESNTSGKISWSFLTPDGLMDVKEENEMVVYLPRCQSMLNCTTSFKDSRSYQIFSADADI
jgi:hypothetical protein